MKKKLLFLHTKPWRLLLVLLGIVSLSGAAPAQISLASAHEYPEEQTKHQPITVITIKLEDAGVKEMLEKVEAGSGFRFVYDQSVLKADAVFNLHEDNIGIYALLQKISMASPLRFKQVNNHIYVKLADREMPAGSAEGIDLTVRGKVLDQDGEPIPGVTVSVPGTSIGTATDLDGEYSLTVPEGSTLVFSFIGFETQTFEVGDQSIINVTMREDMASLDEVVVVGYGEQRKVTITGAISALDERDFGRRQVGQTSLLLQGIAPGVTVTQRSGQPGRDAGSVRIRGIGTIGDANPLVLVDGVEMSMNNIDPGTIESISVLKDAASSAIYGSRAANGVILVTTKRAKMDQSSINYSAYYGVDHPTNLPDKVNALDHMIYHDIAYVNSGRDPIFEGLIQEYRQDGGVNTDRYPDTDWMDVLLKPGQRQNHLLSFNKGYEKLRLAATFGYYKQNGIIENSSFERLNLRLNSDLEISPKISAKFDLMFTHGDRPEPISEGKTVNDIFFQMYRIPANQPAIFSNGLYGEGWSDQNPLAWAEAGGINRIKSPEVNMNFQFQYKPLDWLTADLVFAPVYSISHNKSFVNTLTLYNPDGSVFAERPSIATLNENFSRTFNKTLRATLLAEQNFGDHNLKILGGVSQEDYANYFFGAYREGFILPQYNVLNAGGQDNKDNSGSSSEWALLSFFGRVNYDFQSRYLLEFTARYDGSSRFATKNRFALFPSMSAGWRLSEEAFMKPLYPLFSDLKVRASWGTLGNQNIGNSFYPYISSVPLTVNYTFGNTMVSGARLLDLANEDLKWEQTEMYNVGLDMEFFGKLSVTADYFDKSTTDVLLRLNIPTSLGLNAPFQNAGTVSNKGWELGVRYLGNVGAVNYSLTGAFSDVVNKIEDLKGISSTALTQNREGFPMNSLYGHVATGYFQNENDIENHPDQFGIEVFPGDIKYKDIDGNNVIDDNDREIFGNTIPRYTYSLNLNLEYSRFDLGLFLQGVGKADGYLNSSAIMPFFNGGTIYEYHKDYWTPDNPNAAFPRLVFNAANNQRNSSFWMKSAAYLRLKNVQLGYSLSPTLLERLKINSLRVYITGENLFSLDNFWEGFDVEAPVGSGNFYPQVKTYSVGLNINL
ncbi:MAG TPA: TonB-dependent receptor [Cyclobacteriaceae bacterium]|nr:TonB-dependent receptor [Cyclobacteriaceae bacterium]